MSDRTIVDHEKMEDSVKKFEAEAEGITKILVETRQTVHDMQSV